MNRQNAFLLALGLLFLAGTGCTSSVGTYGPYSGGPTDWVASGWRSHVWANRAYETSVVQAGGGERIYSGDYKRGFVAGYRAICEGSDGEIPAVPPRKYWGSRYLSPEGQAKSRAWFEGYPAGVQAAQTDGIDSYRDIYVSQLLDDMHRDQTGYAPAIGEHMEGVEEISPAAIQPVPMVPTETLDVPPEPSANNSSNRSLNQAWKSMTAMLKRDAT